MQEDNGKERSWIKYVVTAGSGLVAAIVLCLVKGIFKMTETKEIVRVVCDAFTLVGLIMMGCGLLTVLNKAGAFDGLGYTFKSMKRVWTNYRHDENFPKTYYDYKQSVKGKRSSKWYLVIIGAGYLLIGIVLVFVHGAMA